MKLPSPRSPFLPCLLALALAPALRASGPDPLAVLERNCIACHNAHEQKGKVILDRSPVQVGNLTHILDSVSGPEPEMPKGRGPLAPEELAALEAWVKAGAAIPEGRVLQDTYVPGREWWSLRPIAQGQVPDLTLSGAAARNGAGNEIDAFLREKLEEKGLSPSPEAPPRVLARRLHHGLTGLPPEPERLDAFERDYASRGEPAYAELVEELLESSAHGEHFARHWLDVARYGETHGYDKDKPRPEAWPYRDYVIRSFNQDKPWSRFVQEQIAGDALWPGDPDGVVALGFIAAGPWDFIAHFEVGEGKVDGRIAKHMDRDDMVSAVFNAFMSTTADCAQCHHHKFDPVSMEDYYRLHAVFAAVDRAPRVYDLDPEIQRRREDLAETAKGAGDALKALDKRLEEAGGAELAQARERLAELRKQGAAEASRPPEHGYHSQIAADPGAAKWIQVELPPGQVIREIELIAAWDDYAGIGAGFGFPRRYRVEVSDDAEFREGARTLADRTGADTPNPGIIPVKIEGDGAPARYLRLTATRLAERKGDYILALAELRALGQDGEDLARGAAVTALDSIEQGVRWGKANLVDGIYPQPADAAAAAEMAGLLAAEQAILDRIDSEEARAERAKAEETLAAARAELAKLPEGKLVYAAATHFPAFGKVVPTKGQPRAIRLLHRGDINTPGEEMAPGAPPLWDGAPGEFGLPPGAPEGERRAALARYLTDPENPLAWRSIANRVWLWHFGRGLVDSPNDFGRMGMEPTHPELLDFLAARLRDDPAQSLKSLHRLIVTSAAWRQDSARDPVRAALDGDNAYYWRAERRRLSAEEIRDAVLWAAGKLNREAGGPSFQDFVIEKPQHSPHYQYHLHDQGDPKAHRRSIYRMIVRSQTQPFLTSLDCADPSQMVAKRDETTTALQSLALMNNPFMTAMAGHLASRVAGEAEPASAAFTLAAGRPPAAEEASALAAYAEAHGLANACRVILNLSEFAYLD